MQEEIGLPHNRSAAMRFTVLAKIYPASVILALTGLFLSAIGMLSIFNNIDLFLYLLIYMPILWIFWLVCVFTLKGPGYFLKIIILWLIIDLSILFLYIMLANEVPNWGKSRGIEVVMAITYLPVTFPFGFLVNIIPTAVDAILQPISDTLIRMAGPCVGEALTIWLEMSTVAVLQSACLIGLVRWWASRKKLQY